jgi:hypothetical protein
MTRPEINYAVHQCARFAHDPKESHELAIKRIGRYLLGTKDQGLILKPDLSKGFEVYPDADWAGNWEKEYSHDLTGSKSRTGYVIFYAGCPIVWGSKMQPLISLSTTEAELQSLSSTLRETLGLMNLLQELQQRGFPIPFTKPTVRCKVYEDNAACIQVATQPKMRPRTKHLSVRLHHFRQHVLDKTITIEHISTKDQIGDIMTKALPGPQFKKLRRILSGW